MKRDRWVLTFEALPHDVPVTCRVRALLKYALRSLRLRCVDLSDERSQTPRDASERADTSASAGPSGEGVSTAGRATSRNLRQCDSNSCGG